MSENIPKGIQHHWRLSITTIKGDTQNLKFDSRNDAQVALNTKRAFGEISRDEWLRLTDLLSSHISAA